MQVTISYCEDDSIDSQYFPLCEAIKKSMTVDPMV